MNDEIKSAGEEYALRTSQLRNFRRVLGSSMPKKRYDYLSMKILPDYLRRYTNAQNALTMALDKKYKVDRSVSEKRTTAKKAKSDTLTNVTKEKA